MVDRSCCLQSIWVKPKFYGAFRFTCSFMFRQAVFIKINTHTDSHQTAIDLMGKLSDVKLINERLLESNGCTYGGFGIC